MRLNEKSDQRCLRMSQKMNGDPQAKVKDDRILSSEEATF